MIYSALKAARLLNTGTRSKRFHLAINGRIATANSSSVRGRTYPLGRFPKVGGTLVWCTRPDGSTEFLNKRWHDYTGCSPEESRVHGWQPTVHPEDLPRVIAKGQELLTSGQPGEVEGRIRRHDGVFRWFLMRVEPLRDETGKIVRWYGTQTDIDALKQIEEKLREEHRELRQITDAIPQTIVVVDLSGAPIYANQAMLDYTGLSAEDVLASHFREHFAHPEGLEKLKEQRE